jgi:hypothetical protein
MSPEKRFERIEALLHGVAERENQWRLASPRNTTAPLARMEKAKARMDKFDKLLQATWKLLAAGVKMLVRLSAEVREVSRIGFVATAETAKSTREIERRFRIGDTFLKPSDGL